MKKLIYPLLTLSILFTIGCDDDKKEESVDLIIGTWTLSAAVSYTHLTLPTNREV